MTTDNRTNEPTPEQVEAADAAFVEAFQIPQDGTTVYEVRKRAMRAALVAAQGATPTVGIRALAEAEVRKSAAEGNPICEPGVTKDIAFIRGAVFGAAQEAAPQPGAYDHCCQHPKCPGGSLCCCASEQRLRDCWNQWLSEFDADAKQAFRDGYQAGQNDPAPWMAPVLPSSGVDEDALAEVIEGTIRRSWETFNNRREGSQVIARAVAKWLKGD